ncbi:MAG: hypothetical protein KDC55_11510, partial [Ignavibacteriae bacterium]|nr:hypothetical protein [Ignavibacteriota bacterium]
MFSLIDEHFSNLFVFNDVLLVRYFNKKRPPSGSLSFKFFTDQNYISTLRLLVLNFDCNHLLRD